jgi:hypothetical protein
VPAHEADTATEGTRARRSGTTGSEVTGCG